MTRAPEAWEWVAGGFVLPFTRTVVVFGLGYDENHPFSPWPRVTTTPTPKGNVGFCASLLGVWVQVRRKPSPSPWP